MSTYLTTQADTWDSIAYRLYGQERHMHELVAANPEHLDVLVFPAGVELRVPHVQSKAKELPPWK